MLGPLWSALSRFIGERDPAYLGTVKGVPREDISEVEEGCAAKLPAIYVDFLGLMGADSGEFHPFAASQTARFYEVVGTIDPEMYPVDRYFKVSFDNDPSKITRYNLFIDLARSDGEDAPLVRYEEAGDFQESDMQEIGFTLAEMLTMEVFDSFEVARRPETSVLRIYPEPPNLPGYRTRLVGLLAKMGLGAVLPPLPRVGCFRSDALSALVSQSHDTGGLWVGLGAVDRKRLTRAMEEIRDVFNQALSDK